MGAAILNAISFKMESVWGTPVVPDRTIPVRMEGGVVTDVDLQFLSNLRANLAKNYHAQQGNRIHEGEFTMDLLPDGIGWLLWAACGDKVSTLVGGETIVYSHQFIESDSKPSMTLEQKVGENVRRYAGAVVTGFKIAGKAGEPLEFSFPVKAKSSAIATAIVPDFSGFTTLPFDFTNVMIKFNGTDYCEVENFEYEFSNGLDLLHTICNHDPAFKYTGGHESKGKFDLYLNSASLAKYQQYLDSTPEVNFELVITGSAIGVSSNYSLYITSTSHFTSAATELSEDYNKLTLETMGILTTSSGVQDIELINLTPSYA